MTGAPASPPRFWWLKRIAAAYLAVAAAVAATTAVWAWRADVAWRSLQATWRAEGGPATVDEVNAMGPPYDAHAEADGRAFVAAARALQNARTFAPRESLLQARHADINPRAAASAADLSLIRRSVASRAADLAAIGPLLDGRPLDFGVRFRSPLLTMILPDLHALRQVGDALNEAARLRSAEGDHAAAVDAVERLLVLAREAGRPPIFTVQRLVANGIDEDACDAVEAIAGTIDVGPPSMTAPASAGASASASRADRFAVERLIVALLDDAAWRERLKASLRVDRLIYPDHFEADFPRKEPQQPLHRRAFRFGWRRLDERWYPVALRAAGASDLAAAAAAGWPASTDPQASGRPNAPPPRPPKPSRLYQSTRIIAGTELPQMRPNATTAFEHATRRHACATLLAIRLFELDRGRLPTSLDELVSAYLPAVPRDLTRAGAPPLTYVVAPATARQVPLVAIWISDPRHPTSRPATTHSEMYPQGQQRRQHAIVVYRGHERFDGGRR